MQTKDQKNLQKLTEPAAAPATKLTANEGTPDDKTPLIFS
jgi:hypothetical protein